MSQQSDYQAPAAVAPTETAAPGPHPHESDDIRFWNGDDNKWLPSDLEAADTAEPAQPEPTEADTPTS